MNDANSWKGECSIRDGRPVIHVPGQGDVPDAVRAQAATNMRLNPLLKAEIIRLIGEDEARKRYPEAFFSDEELEAYIHDHESSK